MGPTPLELHLHDTRGLGLVNVMAALDLGVERFDTAFGGMGSIRGGLYAAFILGMLEAFVGYWFGMNYVLFALFGVLLFTLAVRPQAAKVTVR
mgnify:CR=1 FL=1